MKESLYKKARRNKLAIDLAKRDGIDLDNSPKDQHRYRQKAEALINKSSEDDDYEEAERYINGD